MHDENVREVFRIYIRELKPFVFFSFVAFLISAIAGYVYYATNPSYALDSLGGLEELAEMLQGLSAIEIMLLIFVNNALKMFLSVLLGFALGIVPLGFLLLNGFVIGIFAHYQTAESGVLFVIAGLTPHGIIEIPMLIISSAIGMKIGYVAFQGLRSEPVDLKAEIIRGIKFYLHWLFPLIFLAAVIETFITPLVIYMVSGV
ncbi:stage II sporulation protein M [Methanolobus sediminis]|uniref:Stage II sporulation protein M n=1 Tax=Methanolobus sediminis TaxID=3072978 RepID=A0AA51UND8_9EURY|nr:stage II sporulation protein M [Methanolobus sediminis]WMW25516.1 stage II sporulation protein M [Methanolobus sediminis]